ncbi:MAG: Gfo/Idh/MocA family oxidoreductase [Planctomycetota bacterium]
MNGNAVRFGIIGTGRITRRLVADLQSTEGVTVTAIASRTKERAEWSAGQFGILNAVMGYESLLVRDDVDVVYIAVPPSLHADLCVAAANAGKDILCEKPLARNLPEAKRITSACDVAGVRWLDATGWLHHARTAEMLAVVQDGQLGELAHLSAAISFYRPFQSNEHRLDPSLGGGCLLDLGWYAAGVCCRFANRLPERVLASSMEESGVPIRVNAMLAFSNSLTASLSCGYDSSTRKWFEVAGTTSTLYCDDFSRPWADRDTSFRVITGGGEFSSRSYTDHQERRMIETLISDGDLSDFQHQAVRTQAVLDALASSIREGRAVSVDSF